MPGTANGCQALLIIDMIHPLDFPQAESLAPSVLAAARCIVVKSRGHFRAGFDEFAPPGRVYEVDTAGLTSPVLANFTWKRLPRPVYPLDQGAVWGAPTP